MLFENSEIVAFELALLAAYALGLSFIALRTNKYLYDNQLGL